MLGAENDEACLCVVWDVARPARRPVNTGEVSFLPDRAQSRVNLIVGVFLKEP
jgi:hypothetical protein